MKYSAISKGLVLSRRLSLSQRLGIADSSLQIAPRALESRTVPTFIKRSERRKLPPYKTLMPLSSLGGGILASVKGWKSTLIAALRFLCVRWTFSWMALFAANWNLSLLASKRAYVLYLEPVTAIAIIEGFGLVLTVIGLLILLHHALIQLWKSAR